LQRAKDAAGKVAPGIVKLLKSERGMLVLPLEGASNPTARIGRRAENIAMEYLETTGYTDIIQLQNKSGHGIDVVARSPQGQLHFFEVKGTEIGRVKYSLEQRNVRTFVESRLRRIATQSAVDPQVREAARRIQDEFGRGAAVQGYKFEFYFPAR